MTKVNITNSISFQYGDPQQKPNPDSVVSVQAGKNNIELVENSPPQNLDDVSLFSFSFSDRYYPLFLYFDGQQFNIPQLTTDSKIEAMTSLAQGEDIMFNIYNQSDPSAAGLAIIHFTVNQDSIGIVIVGTSGLIDP